MNKRNVLILSISQALALAGAPLIVFIGGIVGAALAPSPAWATLPVATMVVGVAAFAIPASFIMRAVGRRLGFSAAALLAALAGCLGAYAIYAGSFALFCLATALIGAKVAFVQQYRFAAAESVDAQNVGKAVSFVLLGGVAAGYFGPELAKRTRDWLGYGDYAGSFLGLAVVYLVVAMLLLFLRDVKVQDDPTTGEERPLRHIAVQPTYLVAVLAGIVSYGIMSFIMTATPVSMHVLDGHSLDATALVIQSHVIGMYLPSLFTGFLIERLGLLKVMAAGVLAIGTCVVLALTSHQLPFYWSALVLLGVGWNFLFVGGTVLLTESYRPAERFKAQATNDFAVFGVQAVASLAAGAVMYRTSWEIVNAIALPFLVVMLVALLALHRYYGRTARAVSYPVPR